MFTNNSTWETFCLSLNKNEVTINDGWDKMVNIEHISEYIKVKTNILYIISYKININIV